MERIFGRILSSFDFVECSHAFFIGEITFHKNRALNFSEFSKYFSDFSENHLQSAIILFGFVENDFYNPRVLT